MPINKTKANKAMEISEGYARILRLRQDIEVEFRKLEAKVEAEGHPDISREDVVALRLAHNKALHKEIIDGRATWHNIAYDRGYYDTEPKARKLSKTDMYK